MLHITKNSTFHTLCGSTHKVCNEEGKLTGMELNRSLHDDDGDIYDVLAGPFLVVGLGEEDFASLPPDLMEKYEQKFHCPEFFMQVGNGILAIPVEPKEHPLRTAEMTIEDDYGMIDGVINNGRRDEPREQSDIQNRLSTAKRELVDQKATKPVRSGKELGER